MKKRICLFLLALSLLLTACAPASQPEADPAPEVSQTEPSQPEEPPAEVPPTPEEPEEPELSQRERDWVEDIEFLREAYKTKHLNPFYFRSEEEFDAKLDLLVGKVEKLSDHDMFFELSAVVASMGDIHTRVRVPDSLYERIFPLDTFFYGGQLYLADYLEGYDELAPYLLREIVAVNGVDIAYLNRKAESINSPGNSWLSKEDFPRRWGFMAAFYDWASGLDPQESYTFQILNENQEVESVEVPVISLEEYSRTEKIRPESFISIPAMFNGDWTAYVDRSGGCVYLAIGEMQDLDPDHYKALFEEAAGLLAEHPECTKLAIDLRSNTGGAVAAFIYMRKHLSILKELPFEQVFVLTGGYTASCAMRCLTLFEEELGAVKVGEPTGQFPSFFMHGSSMTGVASTLPHSQFSIVTSTGWHEGDNPENTVYNDMRRLYEWENTILPDVYVYQDIEDIRQGRDSVLEWVLAQ